MKLQIQRKQVPNDPSARIYYSHAELTQKLEEAVRGKRCKNTFLSVVMEIPGVAFASLAPYHLMVCKPPTFDWDEIEPKLLTLFAAFFLDIESVNREPEQWEEIK